MALAHTDSFDHRSAILQRLTTRNRMVGVLRLLVPAAGVVAFLLLALQIYVANTLHQYGVSGIRIERGALVVDGPQYSAVGSNGAHYTASAKAARAPLADTNSVAMDDLVLSMARPERPTLHLAAQLAKADMRKNVFTIPGTATLTDDAGLHGTLQQLEADVDAGIFVARGPVALTFRNGATLNAANMRFDSTTQVWTLQQVTYTAPDLPEASQ